MTHILDYLMFPTVLMALLLIYGLPVGIFVAIATLRGLKEKNVRS